ncbi:type II toxin-antitoxin system Phd/YefM family antitoxin [Desulfitobacterium chlororespirans]|uniref:Antitoxin n=1 Tax=Desulfitobacterium chlororespirans DSM 11544 TaxID=1121395 RepID=A0A1M7TQC8_9FIRM|nr:type II toxin-antitoxin system Phd/YefM family antitoxin [Desulfitobacterium chlororespirans]SHN72942.1 Antitoxin Phd_YefM, type II toxin-antitoxin system [Desulfitobacterium chlororespirans DSM 11544]
MIIKPTSSLRTELGEITKICKEKAEPVYLTKNGEGELVIMSIAAYEHREAMLDLRTKLLEAEKQRLNGAPSYTSDEVREYIRRLHNDQV